GVLSPLLWCLVADEIIKTLNGMGAFTIGYADDIAVIIEGRYPDTVSELMQAAVSTLENWCLEKELSINPLKAEVMAFTRLRRLEGLNTPSMFGASLKKVSTVKYLGVVLDEKLTWNAHVDRLVKRAKSSLIYYSSAIGKTWGLNPKIAHWLYTAVISPIITYASIVWWDKTRQLTRQLTTQRKLARIHRTGLLFITVAMKTTPTAAMDALLGIPPLHMEIERSDWLTAIGWWQLKAATTCKPTGHSKLIYNL